MQLLLNNFLIVILLLANGCARNTNTTTGQANRQVATAATKAPESVVLGAAQFDAYLPQLKDKRVALVVNQTSLVPNRTGGYAHLVDTLLSQKVQVKKIFAPEHGFRGTADAGEKINSGIDAKTGLPLVSLYGKDKKPSREHLADIDIVIFDIQDVGARFYTYISTMHYVMEACSEFGKSMIVLDRPNPNGHYVDGPVLDMKHRSMVGSTPIPIVHGLTVAELATMINGEGWLPDGGKCQLQVVPCRNYTHTTRYSLPVKPSPNLPNDRAIELYPSLCLFEGTIISVGRGTDFPFQVIGHPDYPAKEFSFTPRSVEGAKNPPYLDKVCYGTDFRTKADWKNRFSLQELITYYKAFKDKGNYFNDFMTRLSGSEQLRKQVEQGMTEEQIRETWQKDLQTYREKRKKYLLYADFE